MPINTRLFACLQGTKKDRKFPVLFSFLSVFCTQKICVCILVVPLGRIGLPIGPYHGPVIPLN